MFQTIPRQEIEDKIKEIESDKKRTYNVLDLKLLDHTILTSESYCSFSDEEHL